MNESGSIIDMKQNMLFIILPILASEVAHGCNQIALPFTTTTSTPSTTTTLAPTTTTPASTTTTEIGLFKKEISS